MFSSRNASLFATVLVLSGLSLVLLGASPLQASALEGTVTVLEKGLLFGTNELDDRSNAVVFVAGFEEPPPAGQTPTLAQVDKSFSERVLTITRGASVAFPNHDRIHHNVWSNSKARPFDLGLYKAPQSKTIDFPDPGIITVFCNIHPQMIATILVLPNTKYAVTGPDGRFRIENVPPGARTVYAWVEGATPLRTDAVFEEGKVLNLDFRLELKRIPLTHLNKEGKRYEEKYDPQSK